MSFLGIHPTLTQVPPKPKIKETNVYFKGLGIRTSRVKLTNQFRKSTAFIYLLHRQSL